MKISVVVTAYNHEKYIAQCMESVLCQKGDFNMEVIVGDDYSTDNTKLILQEFQQKYPGIVFLLPSQKNLGVTKNLKRCLDACTGEYIAICEGDDYWTDEYKLEKQKQFLDAHQDCSMCFSALMIFFEDTNTFLPNLLPTQDFLDTENLIERNDIANFSCCMYRASVVKQLPPGIYNMYIADWMFNIACSQLGRSGFIREFMSVYRKHSGAAWSGMSTVESLRKTCELMDIYNRFLEYKYDTLFTSHKKKIEEQILALTEEPPQSPEFDGSLVRRATRLYSKIKAWLFKR
jgi:glycosyltransferase involved in cell wall biosynthesis